MDPPSTSFTWTSGTARLTRLGGLLLEPGTAGNLPSGETYIVPYEGEIDGDPTASRGQMPVTVRR